MYRSIVVATMPFRPADLSDHTSWRSAQAPFEGRSVSVCRARRDGRARWNVRCHAARCGQDVSRLLRSEVWTDSALGCRRVRSAIQANPALTASATPKMAISGIESGCPSIAMSTVMSRTLIESSGRKTRKGTASLAPPGFLRRSRNPPNTTSGTTNPRSRT